ncbi:MAG: ABC transporter permease [Chloroflexi bacterium]|nr:ABC transporter permease [Chloroflexota bacterium]
MTGPLVVAEPSTDDGHELQAPARASAILDALVRSVGPIILALIACGALLAIIGRDPLAFYGDIVDSGVLRPSGLQDSITRMAPILLVAAGLIVAFRAALWNLGSDGQYLLAAAIVAGTGPGLLAAVAPPLGWLVLAIFGMVVASAWTLIPAILRARYGLNEIVTTLMMTFVGVGLANLLVKGPFDGPSTVPQTAVVDPSLLLFDLPGTRIHIGVIAALLAVVAVYWIFARTSFGMRIDVLGANARAAEHVGIGVPRLIVITFLLSGALIGLAAAVDITGIFGYMRADWNPAYGLKVVPLVFLARLNAIAVIPFAAFFSVLSIGGEFAARRAELPSDFLLLVIGLVLLFMVLTQYLSDKRERGEPILRRRRQVAEHA